MGEYFIDVVVASKGAITPVIAAGPAAVDAIIAPAFISQTPITLTGLQSVDAITPPALLADVQVGISGPPGPQGPPGITQPFRLGHTWGLVGDVTGLSSLPSIFIPFNNTQTAKLVGVRTKLGAGTSVGVQLKRNGSNVSGVIIVTTTAVMTALGNIAITADDEFTMVLSTPVGTPTHLSATLIVEHTP